jgi:microcystin-dependent protein
VSEPFIGEIRPVSFGIVPRGWALCNGQLLSIQQNQALFSILGTTYGGDGIRTLALPNLQGRVPVHPGNGIVLGETAGQATHTLIQTEMPTHDHAINATTTAASTDDPTGAVFSAAKVYVPFSSPATMMDPTVIQPSGGSQPHENMAPYLTINFIIALTGIFPSRSG